jgi:hypothetical protein
MHDGRDGKLRVPGRVMQYCVIISGIFAMSLNMFGEEV